MEDTRILDSDTKIADSFANLLNSGLSPREITPVDLILVFIIIILVIVIFYLFRKYLSSQTTKSNEQQYLLYKTKHQGLSSFQIKTLRGLSDILNLKQPTELLEKPALYEKAIASFLQYVSSIDRNKDAFSDICRDIVIMYEKLYHHNRIKKQIKQPSDIEEDILMYFSVENGGVYVAKLKYKFKDHFELYIFRDISNDSGIQPNKVILVNLWRTDDAEYTFPSNIIGIDKKYKTIKISVPENISRTNEVHMPYIETILPCELVLKDPNPDLQTKKEATLFKINNDEVVIRTSQKIDFNDNYSLSFVLSEFKINTDIKIIGNRSISTDNIFYYTMKFENLSDAAKTVIRKFIMDHM